MKKRLRRKKRIGEFKQIGYQIHVNECEKLDDNTIDEFLDLVENLNLVAFGTFSTMLVYSNKKTHKQAIDITNNEVGKLVNLLANNGFDCEISEPYDIWHDSLC